jgi:ABC-type bacteriocin/lantibiotic exporter with double-glycine peptidase domain
MSRTCIVPIKQPDEYSCGPTALKMALSILGKRSSLKKLRDLCGTNKNGTTTRNMIRAIRRLQLPALVMEKTTLNHLLSALKTSQLQKRAIMVSYLYAMDENDNPKLDSGHWAIVSSYKPSTGRIVLLDSYTGRKTSYPWGEFRRRWVDEKLKKRRMKKSGSSYTFIHKPEKQLMIVMSTNNHDLPDFRMPSAYVMPSRAYIHA